MNVKMMNLIDRIEWGQITVGTRTFRDIKISPAGVRDWDWNETGTRHVPGVQIADVTELVDSGARTIILSRGQELVLQVPAETIAWLEGQGLQVEVLESKLAVARYNELTRAGDEAVAALIHSTC